MPWTLVGIGALPFLLALPLVGGPVQYNDAVFMTVGRGIRNGQALYVDLFDHKPPLIYVWFAIFNDLVLARVALALAMSGTSVLVALIGRHFYGRLGDAAGLAFGLTPLFSVMYLDGSADRLTLLPATAAFYAALKGRSFTAGILIGLAAMVKPVVVVEVLFLFTVVPDWRRYVVGGMVSAGAVVVPVLLLGLGPAAYDAVITFNREYEREGLVIGERLRPLLYWLLRLLPLALPALIGFRYAPRGLQVWTLAGVVGALMTGHPYAVYAWHFVPGAALLLPALVQQFPRWPARARNLTVAPLLLMIGAVGSLTLIQYALQSTTVRGYPSEVRAVANVVHGRVFVASNTPEVYYLSHARVATRYLHPVPLLLSERRLREAIADLQATPPDFIVFEREYGGFFGPLGPPGGTNGESIAQAIHEGFPAYRVILESGNLTVIAP